MKHQETVDQTEPVTGAGEYSTYELRGQVDSYDVDGQGSCLTTVLIAYAADCRKAAASYEKLAAMLLLEARKAEAAATAAEYETESGGAELGKPAVQP